MRAIRLGLSFLLPLVVTADNSVRLIAAVSGNSVIAPDALFSVVGLDLPLDSIVATLDASGKLPVNLAGVTVSIGGLPARLVYVSSDHVNGIVPTGLSAGLTQASLMTDDGSLSWNGQVQVARIAPALLADLSIGNRGAVLNAVTGAQDPFRVQTPENAGTDKSTRLVLYGSGFRYANDPKVDLTKINPAPALQAFATTLAGQSWSLPILQAGPAPKPGAPGDPVNPAIPAEFGGDNSAIDQVTVSLPPGLDATGQVFFHITAESAPSNSVGAIVASLAPPQITSVSSSSVSPGTVLEIDGKNFAAEILPVSLDRNVVVFRYADGLERSLSAIQATAKSLTVMTPMILQPGGAEAYQGPVSICVEVDGVRACAPDPPLSLAPPLAPPLPPGQTLVTFLRQLGDSGRTALVQTGNQSLADDAGAQADQQLAGLQAAIDATLAGNPPTMTIPDSDGNPLTVTFNLDLINRVEALLTAYSSSVPTASLNRQASGRRSAPRDLYQAACMLPAEQELLNTQLTYSDLEFNRKATEDIYADILVGSIFAGCVGGALVSGDCLDGAQTAAENSVVTSFLMAQNIFFTYVLPELAIETGQNYLQSIRVDPINAAGKPGAPADVALKGTFGSSVHGPVQSQIVGFLIDRAINLIFGGVLNKIPAAIQASARKAIIDPLLINPFKKFAADNLNGLLNRLPLNVGDTREVTLSAWSGWVDNPDRDTASLTLACGLPNGQAVAKKVLFQFEHFDVHVATLPFLAGNAVNQYNTTFDLLSGPIKTYRPISTPPLPSYTETSTFTYSGDKNCPQGNQISTVQNRLGPPGGIVYYSVASSALSQFLADLFTCGNCDDPAQIAWKKEGSGSATVVTDGGDLTDIYSYTAKAGVLTETAQYTLRHPGSEGQQSTLLTGSTTSVYDIRTGLQTYADRGNTTATGGTCPYTSTNTADVIYAWPLQTIQVDPSGP
jgi:uncharacterized protein (TIGR03437 family)